MISCRRSTAQPSRAALLAVALLVVAAASIVAAEAAQAATSAAGGLTAASTGPQQQFRHLLQASANGQAPPTSASTTGSSKNLATYWSWDWRNVLGLFISALIGFLTGPGGGGGAQLYYPLFQALLQFDVRQTAALVSFVMALGAFTSTIMAVLHRHPVSPTQRTLVDYSSILVMTPPMLLGVSIGVIFNAILPVWLLYAATITIFTWTLSNTTASFRRIRRREQRERAAAATSATTGAGVLADLNRDTLKAEAALVDAAERGDGEPRAELPTSHQAQEDGKPLPAPAGAVASRLQRMRAFLSTWWPLQPLRLQLLVLLVFAVHTVASLLTKLVAPACTSTYWGMLGLQAGLMLVLTVAAVFVVRRFSKGALGTTSIAAGADCSIVIDGSVDGKHRTAAPPSTTVVVVSTAGGATGPHYGGARGVELVPQEGSGTSATGATSGGREAWREANWEAIQWGKRELCITPLPMIVVGVIAGCLGLGGGFLVLPLLLWMGLHPQCQSGTCKVILLISTTATSVAFLAQGSLPLLYGLAYGFINLAAAPAGVYVMDWVVHRTGRPSWLVLLNVMRFVVGTLCTLAFSAIPAWIATAHGTVPAGFQIQNLCTPR